MALNPTVEASRQLKNLTIAVFLSTMAIHATAAERQPYAVYGPTQSCLYTFIGNETFATCDESAGYIRNLYDKEMRAVEHRVLVQNLEEKQNREEQAWRERRKFEREQEAKWDREDKEAKLRAENPKGWDCVQKRLPVGGSILQPPETALRACAKAFGSKK
jgi:hypothetical protein